MTKWKDNCTGWPLVFLLLAGTMVRCIYGLQVSPWLGAPDQLAWALDIDEMMFAGKLRYTQLVHAPHEGGSFVLGMFSLIFRFLPEWLPPLSLAALLADLAVRFVQVRIIRRVFGNLAAGWFAVWTVFTIPAIIPWSTVNFGLHSISSIFPFMLIYLVHAYGENRYLPLIVGLASAVAVSFSYDSIVILPVCIAWFLYRKDNRKLNAVCSYLLVFAIAMIPHLLLRWSTGNSLPNGADILSLRNMQAGAILSAMSFTNLFTVWFTSLPGSFLVTSGNTYLMVLCALIICMLLLSGLRFFVKASVDSGPRFIGVGIFFCFMIVYALSPFNNDRLISDSYMLYRHLCYILPLLMALIFTGFVSAGKIRKYLVSATILLCGTASVHFLAAAAPVAIPAYRPAGWILVNKYGNNTVRLLNIYVLSDTCYRNELLTGYGWGLAAALLRDTADTASVQKLVRAAGLYPLEYRHYIYQGIRYSFTKNLSPVLDNSLLTKFELITKQSNHF